MKYPRTPHIPGSPGATNDDKIASMETLESFYDYEVVITEKMDGENTTVMRDKVHARSQNSRDHVSRHWVKAQVAPIQYKIPEGMRVFGENLYAKHSIGYENLPSYFMIFGAMEKTRCGKLMMSWDETVMWAEELGFPTVPVLFRGVLKSHSDLEKYMEQDAQGIYGLREGFVMRIAQEFDIDSFKRNVLKYVRKGHVQTDKHWMFQQVEKNGLRE